MRWRRARHQKEARGGGNGSGGVRDTRGDEEAGGVDAAAGASPRGWAEGDDPARERMRASDGPESVSGSPRLGGRQSNVQAKEKQGTQWGEKGNQEACGLGEREMRAARGPVVPMKANSEITTAHQK
ncbi:hypothetical protein I4F81_002698 [Pyropia yezoensis]|uniref:Uncharacterized protein n=1 Tax=Pyropia yezoensis TaxID=2788 RepID=A0ACC3BQB2_PYRYE|nr:hypothetical protein I4F81_002698 [Neopyropia yezoensis]